MPQDAPVSYCKIHPSIGIARVGNSPDQFFIGPEVPGSFDPPNGGYKEHAQDGNVLTPRMKRQAARFRVYAYGPNDEILHEVTAAEATVSWTVHLANRKAEWDRFEGLAGEDLPLGARRPNAARNADVTDRMSLIIDPGPRSVSAPGSAAVFDGGTFLGLDVPLGEIRTDDHGRLIVLGGYGRSASAGLGGRITNYANNDRWFDDTSDGPVTARVTFPDGSTMPAVPSWVIVGPPDYAPAIPNFITMYDVARDAAICRGWLQMPARPSFTQDIYPILARAVSLQWVNERALCGHGPATRSAGHFPDRLPKLASNAAEHRQIREQVFGVLRDPHLVAKVRAGTATEAERDAAVEQAEERFMPWSSGDEGDAQPGVPGTWLTLTVVQYELMRRWAAGEFEGDWQGTQPTIRSTRPLALRTDQDPVTPDGLDRAALEAASGGSFFPGIEAGWIVRNPSVYQAPFRLDHALLQPGDLTKRMAVPWQADFFECQHHWWPWQRPDDVLTLADFDRLQDIDRQLGEVDPGSERHRMLSRDRAVLFDSRKRWARSLPANSPDGDNAMVDKWAELGFVVSHQRDGTPFVLHNEPAFVETETMKYDNLTMAGYFHILVNVEDYPDFVPKARELATAFLAAADYDADPHYATFDYTPEALDRRLELIYDAFVAEMGNPHWLDTGILENHGDVGPFSDAAVVEHLRQKAPLNLVDGAWLQNILNTGPCNEVQANLFAIWADEAGNGKPEQNHCNVYETLLRSVNIYLPPIVSQEFIREDFLPSAFEDAVFQMSVGLSPQRFLPELLGMTLYLEWEATPTLTPIVRLLEGRKINPHFYRLHVGIDNVDSGHGFLAKEAIKLYLDDVREKGGDAAMQSSWKRIWNGYVAWATLGSFGRDLQEHLLLFDGKLAEGRRSYAEQQMVAMIRRKAPVARKSHGSARLGGRLLNELFDDPPALMNALLDEGWLDAASPRDSRFFRELISFTGPMFKVFTPKDEEVILDWVESLRPSEPRPPQDVGQRMMQVLSRYADRARSVDRHDEYELPQADGTMRTVREWFNSSLEELMAALARSEFIKPGSVTGSRFLTEVVGPGGPMDGVLSGADIRVIEQWVTAGCPQPARPQALGRPETEAVEAAALAPEVRAPRRAASFAMRRHTIGQGSVH